MTHDPSLWEQLPSISNWLSNFDKFDLNKILNKKIQKAQMIVVLL